MDPGIWDHEYVCHISAELGEEYTVREGDTLEQPEGANDSAEQNVKVPGMGLAALALGFIFVGSKHGEVSEIILQTFMEKYERGDKSLDEKWAKFMALGLGLLYLGEVTVCINAVRLLTTLQDFRMLLMRPLRH